MSRWKGLPEELDPCVRQLVVRLRRVKDHSGLSLRQLAAKTGYSTSSWERYLAGRSLPPREAVEAMARLGGDDPTRLLALHEVATEAWGKAADPADRADRAGRTDRTDRADQADRQGETTGTEPGTEPGTGAPRPHGRALRIALTAGSVALVLAVAAAVLLAVRLTDGEGRAAAAGLPASATTAPGSPGESDQPRYTCRAERIDGRWYTGNSRTMTAVLAEGNAGPEVAEAQCLLREAGLAPGAVDGIFGPHTERAVRDLQKRAHLVVDGIIGPHTWKALRE
ncbi:transcriptional regulator with XRE-family HTH domain [Streptomyces africanus]|uniref:Transcriptional regulator with XRE-family HTH domain n=1 Tax=Streptomyces africanus TaxID=231024 RepID=A0ABU0QSM9_9ACTN|nr:peptidoglycan-binding protein [Streptomyces africanus]MDQ0750386.1 transcriptional regulator with XRE-family HTH domain [Streptomyces africanus]